MNSDIRKGKTKERVKFRKNTTIPDVNEVICVLNKKGTIVEILESVLFETGAGYDILKVYHKRE